MSLVHIVQATIAALSVALVTFVALGAKDFNSQRRLALATVKA